MEATLRTIHRTITLFAILTAPWSTCPATAQDDGEKPTEASADESVVRQELERLGETLKAAVMSGSMSEAEARRVWAVMSAQIMENSNLARAKAAAAESERKTEAAQPKASFARLAAPRPLQIQAIFMPEFVPRNADVLRAELGFDHNQTIIAEDFLRDYTEAFELASAPLRDGIKRYWQTRADEWLADAFERAQPLEPHIAVERTGRAIDRIIQQNEAQLNAASEKDRETFIAWRQRMIDVSADLNERLGALRHRVQGQLAALNSDGATVTADDLVRMATQLRSDRELLRAEITETLAAIATEAQRGDNDQRFAAAITRARAEQLLSLGRVAGENINPWDALEETRRGVEGAPDFDEVSAALRKRAAALAHVLDKRSRAILDREIEGLAFQADQDRSSAEQASRERTLRMLKPFAAAARRELDASLNVRDTLLQILDESANFLDESYPDTNLAEGYRRAAHRRGFPAEMRPQWSERALASALKLDDLSDDQRNAIHELQLQTDVELSIPRLDAITKRVQRDPALARESIEATFGDRPAELRAEYGPDLWLGFNHERFASINDRIESYLRSILTAEQFANLPGMKSSIAKPDEKATEESRGK